MARLTDLSTEILLLIVQLAMDGNYWCTLTPKTLSLINKRFNRLAGAFLFSNYKLVFRGMRALDTCRLTGRRTEKWDGAGVRARLAHLRSKAAYVKRLTLIDGGERLPGYLPRHGTQQFHHGPPLPAEIIAELLETLRTLTSLTAIAFDGYTHDVPDFPFPEPLWAWLAQRQLAEVSFGMKFLFGEDLGPWTHAGTLSIKNFVGASCRAVQVLRPAELKIEYPYEGPLAKLEPYPELKKLDVTVPELSRVQLCEGPFDIVKTPGLEFSIFLGNPCSFRFHIMGAWRELRKRLPVVFKGINLEQFDVLQTDSTNATVRSVEEGEKPRHQDHIPNPKQDRDDEEMQAHYVRRAMRKI